MRLFLRRLGLVLAIVLLAAVYMRMVGETYRGDAFLYWQSIRSDHLYMTAQAADSAPHGYLYSPAFIQAIWPLLSLPWEIFYGIWVGLLLVLLVWIARPWLACLIFYSVFQTFGILLLRAPMHYFSSGNIELLIALAVVAGFRRPYAYAFLLLTKVTPGIGLLWFVVRGEWRSLGIALGATAAVFIVSFAISPNLWWDWATILKNNAGYPEPAFAVHILPLLPRLAIAALLIAVGARLNARWVVPIATLIAMPYIGDTSLILLVAVAPLLRHDAWTERGSAKEPAPTLEALPKARRRELPAVGNPEPGPLAEPRFFRDGAISEVAAVS